MSSAHDHPSFWLELVHKIGTPILGGSIVGCLLDASFRPIHGALMALGLLLIYLGHRAQFHRT